jgi:cation transport regulator ChaC
MNSRARRITTCCAKVSVTRYYFAYGSNMNPARVSARGLKFDRVSGATIGGIRLTFNKQSREHPSSGHANLTFDRTSHSEGVLYRLRDEHEIRLMDRFEAAPVNYSRDVVVVESEGSRIAAWTYFANAAVIRQGLRPERSYLDHLLAGREYLSPDYFAWLSETVCVDD